MKTAHIFNVAQNSFLIVQGLRALGVQADSYDEGGGYPLQVPHWEAADFDPAGTEQGYWDWTKVERESGWTRPPWAKIAGNDGAEAWYDTQAAYEADLARLLRGQNVLRPEPEQQADLLAALAAGRTPPASHAALAEDALRLPNWRSIRAIAARYDLVLLTGMAAQMAPLLPRDGARVVTFEHATMRYVPLLDNAGARLLAAAYRCADANVITNADCWEAAGMLGVRDRSVFIPHPLDADAFAPLPPDTGAAEHTRRQLLEALHCALLFFAPARFSTSEAQGSKRNDRILYAYRRYLDEAEAQGLPRAGLLLAAWGHPSQVRAAHDLADRLGLQGRIGWLPCLPKRRLRTFYAAVDVVLDQFSDTVGSFGAITVEALACARPVITYLDWSRHAWCGAVLPVAPPVAHARTVDEVYAQLCALAASPARRADLGQRGRAWVECWHALPRIAGLHRDLYQRVLAGEPVTPGVHGATTLAMRWLSEAPEPAELAQPSRTDATVVTAAWRFTAEDV